MLSLLPGGRILVAVEPVNGRKGIDSLAGVVRSVLKGDPLSGDLFVFRTRRADELKILAWMGGGFALYLRRLEKGTFAFPMASDASVAVTPTQLAMILGGLDPAKARERHRYKTPLAARGRRRRVEDGVRAAERLCHRDPAPPESVVVPPRRVRPPGRSCCRS
ncbi:MAG: IS66 family insertion sequence element accessory protein TnpB [Gemmataceae bacterium]|nr:IS66 family insertion sequence element accessory protein TnpB [Gemmataceae bacterium]